MKYAPIIIPTLNRKQHLMRCLNSLAANTGAEHTEVFISVDFPPAERYRQGYQEVKEYLDKGDFSAFKAVHVIYQQENLGAKDNCTYLIQMIGKTFDRYIFTEDVVFYVNGKKVTPAYKENGYQAAVDVINGAISVLPNDEDMWAQKDKYLAFAPTKVTELNILSKSGAVPGEYYDRFNNKYDYAVEFLGDSGWLEFFNGGEYTELTCTIAPSRSFNATGSKMTVYFYADDEKIAEYAVGYKTEPFEVSVPIAGSRIVAIDVEGRVSDGFSVYYVLLADFYAHK